MLHAYLDDSGTHRDSPVVVIGGLLGLTNHWKALDREWREKLANPLPGKVPLSAFHLSHLIRRYGEFVGYTGAEVDALRHDFRQIIMRNNLRQISAVVSRPDWDELVVSPYRDYLGSAEEACFTGFINRSLEIVRELAIPNLHIAYVYDIGRKTLEFEKLIKIVEIEKYRPEVASVTWGKVNETPPLQAADMIAYENYRAAQEWLEAGDLTESSAHFKQMMEGMAGDGFIMDRNAIEAEIRRRGPDGKLP